MLGRIGISADLTVPIVLLGLALFAILAAMWSGLNAQVSPGGPPPPIWRVWAGRIASILLAEVFVVGLLSKIDVLAPDVWWPIGTLIYLGTLVLVGLSVLRLPFSLRPGRGLSPPELGRMLAATASLSVLSFALLVRGFGVDPDDCAAPEPFEALYLGLVTFSTLGYGDLIPCGPARLAAGVTAVMGNIHLGLFVAVVAAEIFSSQAGRDDQP